MNLAAVARSSLANLTTALPYRTSGYCERNHPFAGNPPWLFGSATPLCVPLSLAVYSSASSVISEPAERTEVHYMQRR